MAKRKLNEAEELAPTESQETPSANEPPVSSEGQATEEPKKSKWVPRFGSNLDMQAGVHLVEDRPNKRMTIQFAEKPSAEVLAVVKGEEYGYRYDTDEKLWYKRINQAKPRQSRAEADELYFQVVDMIRAEKGLPTREPDGPAM
jgi:hypothetical protein